MHLSVDQNSQSRFRRRTRWFSSRHTKMQGENGRPSQCQGLFHRKAWNQGIFPCPCLGPWQQQRWSPSWPHLPDPPPASHQRRPPRLREMGKYSEINNDNNLASKSTTHFILDFQIRNYNSVNMSHQWPWFSPHSSGASRSLVIE